MSKYTILGLFFTLIVLMTGAMTVNHMANVTTSQEVDVIIESTTLGAMRAYSDVAGSEGKYGVRAKDIEVEVTKAVAEKQTNTGKTIVVSYKFFDAKDVKKEIPYKQAIDNNMIVGAVQYKVDLYNKDDFTQATGKSQVLKPTAKSLSSTENKIVLKKG